MPKHIIYGINAKIRNLIGYELFRRDQFGKMASALSDSARDEIEQDLNSLLSGYPRNHNYKIRNKLLLPSFHLYERFKLVTSNYPEKLESFLDVGCCRGFYVNEAAQRPDCRVSVGIDVHEPFIAISRRVAQYLNINNAKFQLAALEEVARHPAAYGGPFQTVLVIGTYHYLYWGSNLDEKSYNDHEKIFDMITQICTDRLIFSARLEVNMLPRYLQKKAKKLGGEVTYNTSSFLKNAERFFEVRKAGYLGRYPLFVMSRI